MFNVNLIIAADPAFTNYELAREAMLDAIAPYANACKGKISVTIHCNEQCAGADNLIQELADEHGFECMTHYPTANTTAAMVKNNRFMVKMASQDYKLGNRPILLAFHDGGCKAVNHLIECAITAQIPMKVVDLTAVPVKELANV